MMNEFFDLIGDLTSPKVLVEVAALAGCILLSWLFVHLLGRGAPRDSVWFGRRTVDGLLFPLSALILTYAARIVVAHYQHVAVLKVAIPVLSSLVVIRLLARVLSAVFPESGVVRLVERFMSWVAWLAAILWIVGLAPAALEELDAIRFAFGKSHVSLLTLIQGALSCGLVLVLTLWLSAALERRILSEAVHDLSLRKIAVNTTRAVMVLVGFLLALSAVGVDLTALSVLGGAVGVGLGLGLQKLASNYVSGFVILFERSLRIGDYVKVEGFEGRITDIKTRYTLIRSNAGHESIVPNEKIITERIENFTLADPKVLVSTPITLPGDSDAAQVQALLCAAATGCARVLSTPAPSAFLSNFGVDGLEFTLVFWIEDPQNGQLNVRSDVNLAILQALRSAGIRLPSPQREVTLRNV